MKRNNIYTALLSLSLLGLGACSLDLEHSLHRLLPLILRVWKRRISV